MNRLALVIAALLLSSGCTTHVVRHGPDSLAASCAVGAYEVTVDSWCGNGCDSYPVSHKMRDTRPENQRVELNGMQPINNCVNQ